MTDADFELSVTIASLRRAEGLRRGPYTEARKALVLKQLAEARGALGRCYLAALHQRADPDPIPSRPTAPVVVKTDDEPDAPSADVIVGNFRRAPRP